LRRLLNTVINLISKVSILRYENKGLRRVVFNEKKKRQQGRPLFKELRANNEVKYTFFSLKKIQQVREL
ncbi:uncharacterized protein K441DRAFT_575067, partial [Cenococcum geophilum 1.58]|uniref:uncharacterized protein n=1 Tax=Cenococcum geophilum 1.58 TaxID=794803 RepID=UPI00358E3771